jgi:hypothetical protein
MANNGGDTGRHAPGVRGQNHLWGFPALSFARGGLGLDKERVRKALATVTVAGLLAAATLAAAGCRSTGSCGKGSCGSGSCGKTTEGGSSCGAGSCGAK